MLYGEKKRVEPRILRGGKQDIVYCRLDVREDLPREAGKRQRYSARTSECSRMQYRLSLPLYPRIIRSEPT